MRPEGHYVVRWGLGPDAPAGTVVWLNGGQESEDFVLVAIPGGSAWCHAEILSAGRWHGPLPAPRYYQREVRVIHGIPPGVAEELESINEAVAA